MSENILICPDCGNEIEEANAYGQMRRHTILKGNKVESYEDIVPIEGDYQYECPVCAADITNLIEE